jgi:outer membrane protein
MKKLPWILTAFLAICTVASLMYKPQGPKVAYIRSSDLIYGYFGTKEAMEHYRIAQEKVNHEIDTMTVDIEAAMQELATMASTRNSEEIARLQNEIASRKRALAQFRERSAETLSKQEQELLKGTLAQINAFVETYAKKNDLDVILGTTNEGSLMYGSSELDITEELLTSLNLEHESPRP